ncbi:hypothetical protein ACOSP7_012225 [Xanthoceras sorbifolium]
MLACCGCSGSSLQLPKRSDGDKIESGPDRIHLAIFVAPRHLSPHLAISVAAYFLSPQIHLSSRHDAISHRRYSLAADSPHHLCCTSPSVIAVRRFTDHLGFTAESSRRGKLFAKLG